jgi:hypothetical protein
MVTKSGALLDKPEALAQCRHHWIIEPASGPTSRGLCKICGTEKHFDNVLEETPLDKYDASAFTRLNTKLGKINLGDYKVKSTSAKEKAALSLN